MSSILFGITTRSFHYSHTVGRGEYTGAGFRHPMDLAFGRGDVFYVPNRSREDRPDGVRVTIATIGEEYLGEFGQYGDGDGEFIWPISIALDQEENVYVADQWLNRISIFDKEGQFLAKWGAAGTADGQLNQPAGIAFDANYNLLVVDSLNCRVQRFTRSGEFLSKWGYEGIAPGQFKLPWGIEIDHRGDVYVADWRNDRIQKFTNDGEFLAEFGQPGNGVGEFHRPTGVAVDKDGDIFVADWGNHRVEVLTAEGRHITTFKGDSTMSKWGQQKLDANPDMAQQRELLRDLEPERRFWYPVAVDIDSQGRILVADCSRARFQVYQKDNY